MPNRGSGGRNHSSCKVCCGGLRLLSYLLLGLDVGSNGFSSEGGDLALDGAIGYVDPLAVGAHGGGGLDLGFHWHQG